MPVPVAGPTRVQDPAGDEARAGGELEAHARLRDPSARRDALERWCAAHPAHPGAGRARQLLREVLRAAPWRVLVHDELRGIAWLGSWLVTCGGRRAARWELQAARPVETRHLPEPAGALAALPGEPGTCLLALEGGALMVWRAEQEPLPCGQVPGLRGLPELLAVAPDGRRVLVAGGKRAVLAALEAGPVLGSEPRTLAHRSTVRAACFTPDGARLFTACGEPILGPGRVDRALQQLLEWDLGSQAPPKVEDTLVPLSGLGVSPDGRLLALATGGGRCGLIDLQGDRAAGETALSLDAPTGVASRLAFTPDGRRVVVARGEAQPTEGGRTRRWIELQVWDVATRSLLGKCQVEGLPRALAVDPGGGLAALALEGRVELWDLAALCPP